MHSVSQRNLREHLSTQKIALKMGRMKVNLENDTLRQIAANSMLQIRIFQSRVRRVRRFFLGRWQAVQGEQ